MLRVVRTWILWLCIPCASNLFAREHTHFGVRPLGMGNAFTAVADDYNALFYNPAGLNRIEEYDFEIINPALETSLSTLSFLQEAMKVSNAEEDSTQSSLDLFQKQAGKPAYAAMYLTPHYIRKNFGFGLGMKNSVSFIPHADIEGEIDAGSTIVLPIAFASGALDNRLSYGFGIRILGRAGIDHAISINDIALLSQDGDGESDSAITDLAESGFGVGFDSGLLFTPTQKMKPTIGISVLNLGGTPYKQGPIGQAPKTVLPSVNTGVSFRPLETGPHYILLAMDAHQINQPSHYSHKLKFGSEWGISKLFKMQLGLHDGYVSGGLQIDVGLINLRLATYVVDRGPVVGQSKDLMERRVAMQIKLFL